MVSKTEKANGERVLQFQDSQKMNMKETTSMIKNVERECLNGHQETYIMETTKMMREMAMVK